MRFTNFAQHKTALRKLTKTSKISPNLVTVVGNIFFLSSPECPIETALDKRKSFSESFNETTGNTLNRGEKKTLQLQMTFLWWAKEMSALNRFHDSGPQRSNTLSNITYKMMAHYCLCFCFYCFIVFLNNHSRHRGFYWGQSLVIIEIVVTPWERMFSWAGLGHFWKNTGMAVWHNRFSFSLLELR